MGVYRYCTVNENIKTCWSNSIPIFVPLHPLFDNITALGLKRTLSMTTAIIKMLILELVRDFGGARSGSIVPSWITSNAEFPCRHLAPTRGRGRCANGTLNTGGYDLVDRNVGDLVQVGVRTNFCVWCKSLVKANRDMQIEVTQKGL